MQTRTAWHALVDVQCALLLFRITAPVAVLDLLIAGSREWLLTIIVVVELEIASLGVTETNPSVAESKLATRVPASTGVVSSLVMLGFNLRAKFEATLERLE